MSDPNVVPMENGRFAPPRLVLRESSRPAGLKDFCQTLSIAEVTGRILLARGISCPNVAQAFLAPSLREHLPDPKDMLNLAAAAEFVLDFALSKKRITIFHDFDVDGVTAGAQLTEFLSALDADVRCYVPNRMTEGYGLSVQGIDRIVEAGTELLITVDCGINDVKEIAYAKKRGLQVVVLDHHEPSTLPPADIIVDPAQANCPFQEYRLAAAGVVWMLLILLRRAALQRGIQAQSIPDPKSFMDLAALGTICDMVPLTGVNRLIALRGLELMKRTQRIGLRALMEVAGVFNKPRFGAGQVSFALGPRINAAGRLDDASCVGELFATKDKKRAKRLAEKIDKLNSQRRQIEEQVKRSCLEHLRTESGELVQPALAVFGEDYHQGVIGIVAQRLVEEFHRPAAVMAPGEILLNGSTKNVIKGSVRSIQGFHVAEVLHSLGDLLISGGGHAAAGGFSLELDNLEAFRSAFVKEAQKRLSATDLRREVRADVATSFSEVDFLLVEELHRLAPFGVGNASPVLFTEKVHIDAAQPLGDKHLRLRLNDGTTSRQAVAWGFLGHPKARRGEEVAAVYQVDINTYQGVSSLQLNVKALL